MPTRNVSLTPEQDAFIDDVLEKGEYRNASEAMRDAIRALQQRRAEEALKLEKLRIAIDQGLAALDRGDYTEVDDEGLDAYLDELAAPHTPVTARGALSAFRTGKSGCRFDLAQERGASRQASAHPLSRVSDGRHAPRRRRPAWTIDGGSPGGRTGPSQLPHPA